MGNFTELRDVCDADRVPRPAVFGELLLEELPLARAVKLAASISGVARSKLYEQALAWRRAGEAEA